MQSSSNQGTPTAYASCHYSQYAAALRDIPPSGGGGCHTHLLRIANYGVLGGLSDEEIHRDIRSAIHGTRRVPDKEIFATIEKARCDHLEPFSTRATPIATKKPKPRIDGKRFLKYLIKQGRDHDEADLWEVSPIRIDWPRNHDAIESIQRLYSPDDMLFLGARHVLGTPGRTIRTAAQWLDYFRQGGHTVELIMPNPLSGIEGRRKDDKPSYRSDDCVKSFRFAVVEFDNLSREDQIAFWWSVNLPVAALIDSGGKSIHGWIRVDCLDACEWTEQVEDRLFRQYLMPLGIDNACRNESRLSRLPGHKRKETGRWQRLLYLAPEGRRVAG